MWHEAKIYKHKSKFFSCASSHENIPGNWSIASHIKTSAIARGEWLFSPRVALLRGIWLTVGTDRMLVGTQNNKGNVLDHRSPNFLWWGTTPVVMGCFVGRTWKSNTNRCRSPLKLLCNLYCIHVIYKCGREQRNITRLAGSWRQIV